MTTIWQLLPANTKGRDFIVGDLHGCLDLFKKELDKIQFDDSYDRVFSVGDLADRGQDSMGCLRLLRKPWFYAVCGNHDLMLLNYAIPSLQSSPFKDKNNEKFLKLGGKWVKTLSESEHEELNYELIPLLLKLPRLISVGQDSSRFHVTHAELLSGDPYPPKGLRYDSKFSYEQLGDLPTDTQIDSHAEEILKPRLDAMLFGRRIYKYMDLVSAQTHTLPAGELLVSNRPWHPGLSICYVGHSPTYQMRLHLSHFFLDRGAYRRDDYRSCLQMVCHQQVQDWLP